MKQKWFVYVAILACAIPGAAPAQVVPTSEWISLWSDDATLNSNPVPVGAMVQVYDPEGVLCGEFQVNSAGAYGLVPVYRDDPLTLDVDEGAEPGDSLRITIDGFPARAIGPDAAKWTGNGDVLRVDLRSEGVIPTSQWVSFWSDDTRVGGAPVAPGAVVRAYDPGGVLCGQYAVASPGEYGLMSIYRDDSTTPDFDEGAEPGDEISFTIDYEEASAGGPDLPVWSANGDVRRVDLAVSYVPTLLVASTVRAKDGTVELEWTLAEPVDTERLALLRRTGDIKAERELAGAPVRRLDSTYRAVDSSVEPGRTYGYRLRLDGADGWEYVDLGEVRIVPPAFALLAGYPNPFRESTSLRFDLGTPAAVTLVVYDAAGHRIRRLLDQEAYPAGHHEVFWDGRDDSGGVVPVGVYFVRLRAGSFLGVRKTALIR